MNERFFDNLATLRETVDIECKLAAGRDGQGALPGEFFPTYSAFANTDGGVVILGVREKAGIFTAEGILNVAKVRKELFDNLNNPEKVSANLLQDSGAREVIVDGKTILVIEIPRAGRKHRPVHLTTNPFSGHTFRRLNDGDRVVPDDEVKRMLAEQIEDSRDDRILRGYDWHDIDAETFRAYRQVFALREPNHPWNAAPDQEFMRHIGGWRKDQENETAGLTVAGLLMFGKLASIQDEFPNYMLDYQERPEAKTENRWIDRLTLDGKWSGNLYDFYKRVYLKLTADLKVPFALERGTRKDETPIHEALREALSNVLAHADYTDRASVLIVKRPDMFGFRNPGGMRIPPATAIQGGESDCRNRTLHKMFRLVGVGEQAGSGIPKIYRGWASQHWRAPALSEKIEPYNQTILELRMIDLLPAETVALLRKQFGMGFDQLSEKERLSLAAAATERVITHARVREITGLGAFEATQLLQRLVRDGLLESHNPGRGAVYCLAGAGIPTPEEVFGEPSAANVALSSAHSEASSTHLNQSSAHLAQDDDDERDAHGRRITDQLPAPIIDSLDKLTPAYRADLEKRAEAPRQRAKLPTETMRAVVLDLCTGHFITVSCLAELVHRDVEAFRQQYLRPLTRDKLLELAFPTTPTHLRQAYRTASAPTTAPSSS